MPVPEPATPELLNLIRTDPRYGLTAAHSPLGAFMLGCPPASTETHRNSARAHSVRVRSSPCVSGRLERDVITQRGPRQKVSTRRKGVAKHSSSW